MPIKTTNVQQICALGTVAFGPKVLATDPCYTVDTWCNALVDGVLPGEWDGYALEIEDSGFGRRVAIQVAHHRNHPVKAWSTCWRTLSGNVGVDSGQCGLFDYRRYPKGPSTGEYGDSGSVYGKCCEVTLANPSAGRVRQGFVTESGIGDGCYSLLGQVDRKGQLVALALVFLPFSGMWRAMSTPVEERTSGRVKAA